MTRLRVRSQNRHVRTILAASSLMERDIQLTFDICRFALLGRKNISVLIDCANAGFEPVLAIVDEVASSESRNLVINVSLEYVCAGTEPLIISIIAVLLAHQLPRCGEQPLPPLEQREGNVVHKIAREPDQRLVLGVVPHGVERHR